MLMQLIGDYQTQDLTPKTTNLGDRLVKNMRICGSGVYTYHKREAPLLHLSPIPEKYRDLEYINVYRPPEVLKANKDKFSRVPIITGHHVLVNRDNAKELVVGMVGDTVDTEVDKEDGELYLYTTGTIVAGDGVDAYEQFGQLSVGYDPTMEWCEGEHNGVPYQARLTGFQDVNHLLICKTARGGPQCMVMDSLDDSSPLERFILTYNGGKEMNLLDRILGKKPLAGDSAVVSTLIQSIAVGADPKTQVEKIKSLVAGDETFNGYLDELAAAKNEKPEVLAKACNLVDEYYKKMAGDEEKKTITVDKKKDGEKDVKVEKTDDGEKETVDVEHEPDGDKKVEVKKESAGDAIDYDLIAQKTAAILMAAQKPASTAGDEKEPVQGTVVMGGDSKADDPNALTSDKIMEVF